MELIGTPRLRLEPLSPAHADPLCAIYFEPAVRRFLITCPETRPDFDGIFARALQFGASHGMWALIHKATLRLIGRVGFFAFGESARPELAFLLSEAFWGQGLATEAAAACVRYAFDRRGWEEVVAVVRPANTAAVRVLTKLRMRPDQTVVLSGEPATVYQVSRGGFGEHLAQKAPPRDRA